SAFTAIPLTKSTYPRPSASNSLTPLPRTNSTGARLYVPRMELSIGTGSPALAGWASDALLVGVCLTAGAVMRTCSRLGSTWCRDPVVRSQQYQKYEHVR